MNAGLPGLGLGGLFFLLTALLAPAIEVWRTVRGESSAAAWARVGRQFALAIAMIAAIDLTLRGVLTLAGAHGSDAGGVMALPHTALAITLALLAGVLAGAKVLQLALRARELGLGTRALEILIARPRLRTRSAVAVACACAAVLVGAAELDPVPARGGEPPPRSAQAERGASAEPRGSRGPRAATTTRHGATVYSPNG